MADWLVGPHVLHRKRVQVIQATAEVVFPRNIFFYLFDMHITTRIKIQDC